MANRVGWFLAELKRRRVYHVAVTYAVVAFVVWQLADIAFPGLGLPDSAITLVLALTILGFPIALVLAWAYELGPDGVRPEGAGDGAETGASTTVARSGDESDGPAPALDAGAGSPGARGESTSPGGAASGATDAGEASVAVLPFANLGPSPEGDFFSDGMTEEITHALARSRDLRVVARTSAFAFKGQASDAREVARRLGVAYLLEGSVRRSGARLRVTAQLIEAEAGVHVWSERYDRELDDVFRIQDEIAGHIAARLSGELIGTAADGPEDGPGDDAASGPPSPRGADAPNVQAYDAYLQARRRHARFDPGALGWSIERYRESIRIDPEFAPAHAALAEAYTSQSIGLGIPSRQTMPQARAAADRALELAPDLADAHLARALVALFYEWDYDRAKRGIDEAIRLKPNYAEAFLWEEFYWTYVRHRREEAIAATRKAQELNPLDPSVKVRLGAVYYVFGDPSTAVDYFEARIAEDPEQPMFYMGLGDALGRIPDLDGAVRECQRAVDRMGGDEAPNAPLAVLGIYRALRGERDEPSRILGLLNDRAAAGHVVAFWKGVLTAALGDIDGAFGHFERGLEERDASLLYLKVVPPQLDLRDDPRYGELRRRMNLPEIS